MEIFIDDYQFIGVLNCEKEIVENCQIEVRLSEYFPYKITGNIIGTPQKYDEIANLLNYHMPDKVIKLKSQNENDIKCLESSEISFPSLTFPANYPKFVAYKITTLEFNSIKIIQKAKKSEKRTIYFYLHGPQNVLNCRRYKYENNRIITEIRKEIDINENLPFKLYIDNDIVSKTDENNTSLKYEYELLSITSETYKTIEELGDDEFLDRSKKIIGELLLLVSFVGKKMIEWFSYSLHSQGKLQTYVKSNVRSDRDEPSIHDVMIGYNNTLKFIKNALPKFRKLKLENYDLSAPIIFYLSQSKMPFIEASFQSLFTALEYIKTVYVKKNKMDKILSYKKFRKISHAIKSIFSEDEFTSLNLSSTIIKEIQCKIPELNRYSIASIIKSLCYELDIDLKHFYPKRRKVTLFKVRNNLVHASSDIDIDLLHIELIRLRLLIEVIILKTLGWNDLKSIFESYDMEYVKS